jgi:hypothetical protein
VFLNGRMGFVPLGSTSRSIDFQNHFAKLSNNTLGKNLGAMNDKVRHPS